jgi:hypothetical protein
MNINNVVSVAIEHLDSLGYSEQDANYIEILIEEVRALHVPHLTDAAVEDYINYMIDLGA